MDTDTAVNADDKEEKLQVEETDDICRVDFIEITPLATDTELFYTTDLKQEPHDVCVFFI